jgi:hypothetical protein
MVNEAKGNAIFPDTQPINPQYVNSVRKIINKELAEIGLTAVSVGSSWKEEPDFKSPEEWSGDVDTMVDIDSVIQVFQAEPDLSRNRKDTLEAAGRRALRNYFNQKGYQTAQAGVNVFVRVPYKENFYQVDLECIRKVSKVSRYHQHNIPKDSPYKGVSKQLMLAILAKQKGYIYSAWEGLFIRTLDNKKGELVADDWDNIAEKLVGIKDGNAIDSVEAIVKSLPPDQGRTLLAIAKQDKNWVERSKPARVGTNEWFRRMLDML